MPAKPTSSKASATQSCSLLFNNLSAGRSFVGYVHHTSACILPQNAIINGSSSGSVIKEPNEAQIQQIRWVPLNAGELLVVASTRSLQMYTPDGGRLLHVVTAGVPSGEAPATYRGIGHCSTGQTEYVVGGCSTGAVCLIPLAPGEGHTFVDPLLSPASTLELVDLTAGPAPPLDPDRVFVCSADAQGDVNVHALEADGTWAHAFAFAFSTSDETPALCTSLRMRGQRLFCAFSTGQVRIFDLGAGVLTASINAHVRWINAIEVHPLRDDLFATASEDSTIGLWKCMEPEGKVVHCSHFAVTDWLLTGVAFVGSEKEKASHVAVSAYDQAAVQAWNISKV